MNNKYKQTIDTYTSYLKDVYNGALNDNELIAKYGVGSNIKHALIICGYSDKNGLSTMTKPPTAKDAEIVRKTRHDYDIGKYSKRKYVRKAVQQRTELILPVKKRELRKTSKLMQLKPASTKEISILWGAIKITL